MRVRARVLRVCATTKLHHQMMSHPAVERRKVPVVLFLNSHGTKDEEDGGDGDDGDLCVGQRVSP